MVLVKEADLKSDAYLGRCWLIKIYEGGLIIYLLFICYVQLLSDESKSPVGPKDVIERDFGTRYYYIYASMHARYYTI